ncbi:MAG: PilZ domain-containing protein [Deltaproteobacteria bacterium]|nr:PilZ domain-containing protein [Deltaproteobacteria bacterium]
MNKTWSTNVDEISKEIDLLVYEKAKLFCLREKGATNTLFVKGKTRLNNSDLLVLSHPEKNICPKNQCLFYYHTNGSPVRGFHCTPEKLVNGLLAVHYPKEIFEIQRRKFPRVPVARDSRVSFSLLNRHRFHVGRIEDISLEGARISGEFPVIIEKGAIVTPITLTLIPPYLRQPNETNIHIPEATVIRSIQDEDITKELAIHFILNELQQQEALERYILSQIKREEEKGGK